MRLFASWHRSALFPAALSGAAHFPERHGEGRRSALDRHRQPQRGPHPRHRDHRTFFCANMRRVNEALRKAGFRMRKTWYTAAMSGDTKIVGLWRAKHKTGEAASLPTQRADLGVNSASSEERRVGKECVSTCSSRG